MANASESVFRKGEGWTITQVLIDGKSPIYYLIEGNKARKSISAEDVVKNYGGPIKSATRPVSQPQSKTTASAPAPKPTVPASEPALSAEEMSERLGDAVATLERWWSNQASVMHLTKGNGEKEVNFAAQQILIDRGLMPDQAAPDGDFGDKTASGLYRFQGLFDKPLNIDGHTVNIRQDSTLGGVTTHALIAYVQAEGNVEKAYGFLEQRLRSDTMLMDYLRSPGDGEPWKGDAAELAAINYVMQHFGGKGQQRDLLSGHPLYFDTGAENLLQRVTIELAELPVLELPAGRYPDLKRDPKLGVQPTTGTDKCVTKCGITFYDKTYFSDRGIHLTDLQMENVIVALHKKMAPEDFQAFARHAIATRHQQYRAYDVFHPALQYNMMDLDLLKTNATRFAMLNALVRTSDASPEKPFSIKVGEHNNHTDYDLAGNPVPAPRMLTFTSNKDFTAVPSFTGKSCGSPQLDVFFGSEQGFTSEFIQAVNAQFTTPEKGAAFLQAFNEARLVYHEADAARGADRHQYLAGWKNRTMAMMPNPSSAPTGHWAKAHELVQGYYQTSLQQPAPEPSALRLVEAERSWNRSIPFSAAQGNKFDNVVIQVVAGKKEGEYAYQVFYHDDVVVQPPRRSNLQKAMEAQPAATYIPLTKDGKLQPHDDLASMHHVTRAVAGEVGRLRRQTLDKLAAQPVLPEKPFALLGVDISHGTQKYTGQYTPINNIGETDYANLNALIYANIGEEAGVLTYCVQEDKKIDAALRSGIKHNDYIPMKNYSLTMRLDAIEDMQDVVRDEFEGARRSQMSRLESLVDTLRTPVKSLLGDTIKFEPLAISNHFNGPDLPNGKPDTRETGLFFLPTPGAGAAAAQHFVDWSGYNGGVPKLDLYPIKMENPSGLQNKHETSDGKQRQTPIILSEAFNGAAPSSEKYAREVPYMLRQAAAMTAGAVNYMASRDAVVNPTAPALAALGYKGGRVYSDQLFAFEPEALSPTLGPLLASAVSERPMAPSRDQRQHAPEGKETGVDALVLAMLPADPQRTLGRQQVMSIVAVGNQTAELSPDVKRPGASKIWEYEEWKQATGWQSRDEWKAEVTRYKDAPADWGVCSDTMSAALKRMEPGSVVCEFNKVVFRNGDVPMAYGTMASIGADGKITSVPIVNGGGSGTKGMISECIMGWDTEIIGESDRKKSSWSVASVFDPKHKDDVRELRKGIIFHREAREDNTSGGCTNFARAYEDDANQMLRAAINKPLRVLQSPIVASYEQSMLASGKSSIIPQYDPAVLMAAAAAMPPDLTPEKIREYYANQKPAEEAPAPIVPAGVSTAPLMAYLAELPEEAKKGLVVLHCPLPEIDPASRRWDTENLAPGSSVHATSLHHRSNGKPLQAIDNPAAGTGDTHGALDGRAEVGTPVFAPCAGKITRIARSSSGDRGGFMVFMQPDADPRLEITFMHLADHEAVGGDTQELGRALRREGMKQMHKDELAKLSPEAAEKRLDALCKTGDERFVVQAGQRIEAGQIIALSGNTGYGMADSPHLHMGVRDAKSRTPINMFADMGDATVRQYYEKQLGYVPNLLPAFTVFNQVQGLAGSLTAGKDEKLRVAAGGNNRALAGAIIYEPPVDISSVAARVSEPAPADETKEQAWQRAVREYAQKMAAKQNAPARLVGMGVLPEENASAIVATLAKREEERLLAEAQADMEAQKDQDAQDINTLLAGSTFFLAKAPAAAPVAEKLPTLTGETLSRTPQVAPQVLLSDVMTTPVLEPDAFRIEPTFTMTGQPAVAGLSPDVTLATTFEPSLTSDVLLALRKDAQLPSLTEGLALRTPLPQTSLRPLDMAITPSFDPEAFRIDPTLTMTGQPSVAGLSPDVTLGSFEPSLSADALLALRQAPPEDSLSTVQTRVKLPMPADVVVAPVVDLAALKLDTSPSLSVLPAVTTSAPDATLATTFEPSLSQGELAALTEKKKAADFAAILEAAQFEVAVSKQKKAPEASPPTLVVAQTPALPSGLQIGPISFADTLPVERGAVPTALAAVSLPAASTEPVIPKNVVTPPESSPGVIAAIMQKLEAEEALQRTELVARLSGFAEGQVEGPERYTQNPSKRFAVIEDAQAALIHLNLLDNRTKRNPQNEPDGFGGERTFAALHKAQAMLEGKVIRIGDEKITIRKPVDAFDQTAAKLLIALTFAGGDADKTVAVLEEMAQTDKQLMLALQDPTRKEGKALAMHAVEYKSDATTALDPKVADALQAAAKGRAPTASGEQRI